jgi:hypothetical protein
VSALAVRTAWAVVGVFAFLLVVAAVLSVGGDPVFDVIGPVLVAAVLVSVPVAVVMTGVRAASISLRRRREQRELRERFERDTAAPIDPAVAEMRQDFRPPRGTWRMR